MKDQLLYVAGRVVQAVVVLWASYTVTFIILNLLPANPIDLILHARGIPDGTISGPELEAVKHQYGLDQTPLQQYFTMLVNALHGDFGTSYMQGLPVGQLIAQRLSNTLVISGLSIVVSFIGAFLLAFFAAYTRHDWIRNLINMLPTLGVSVPSFWIGLLLMQVFSFGLGLLPAVGTEGWQTLILPTVTMSIPMMALLSRLLITGFEEVLHEEFITTAKAHGLNYRTIIVTHVLRNGALPAFTMLGLVVGHTVTGAIVAETVFSRQGVGMLVQQSVENQDIPVVQGVVLLAAAAFVVINLIVDLIYPVLDPRISHIRKGGAQ